MLRHAIVRPPSERFAEGLTTSHLGAPDLRLALAQHAAYVEALERCGLAVTELPADPLHPDSTFVEDTAVLVPRGVVLTRPGAPSREGEVEAIRSPLSRFFPNAERIEPPGTLEGGDVCEAGDRFLIGLSGRTNEAGAGQLAAYLKSGGSAAAFVDIRGVEGVLHLKSGIAYAGEGRMVAAGAMVRHPEVRRFEVVPVEPEETYAANCVRVNGRLLVAAGHPRIELSLRRLGYELIVLEMSEFQKMDGGLSCLSLRF